MAARITLTRDIAFAAGTDAANAQMRKAGRKAWSIEDLDLAAITANRLLLHIPLEQGGLRGLPQHLLLNHVDEADILKACL